MKASAKIRKPKAGLLLIASPRFKELNAPKRGSYHERKLKAVEDIKASMDFLELVYPGIVYERSDAQAAMDLFYNEKVDFRAMDEWCSLELVHALVSVQCHYLGWSRTCQYGLVARRHDAS